MAEQLTVHLLQPGGEAAWQAFLTTASNATLFHDLDFLAYHPRDRFRFHHLVVRNGDQVVALVPGGLDGGDGGIRWRSPVGASVGGPALAPGQRVADTFAIVEALQHHARAQGWAGIEMTLPPAVYDAASGEVIGFALFRNGFRERHRWLCPMVDLSRLIGGASASDVLFDKRQAHALRGAMKEGGVALEAGAEALGEFEPLFEGTYARLGVKPTHTLDEIETLLLRFPDRVRLVLAREGDNMTAGLLVMQVTPAVATTFYICRNPERLDSSGTIVALAALVDRLRERGCRWLDLGPSASDTTFNSGVMFFKEGLGGVGYCRSEWSWTTTA